MRPLRLAICLVLLGVARGQAQPLASPALTQSCRQLTVGFSATLDRRAIGSAEQSSPRLLLQALYGPFEGLGLFGEIGLANLSLQPHDASQSNLTGSYRLALGGGVAVRLHAFKRVGVFVHTGGRFFWFRNQPSARSSTNVAGTEFVRTLRLNYEWREADGYLGLAKALRAVYVYAGLSGNVVSRPERKSQSVWVDGSLQSEVSERGAYQSGLRWLPYVGLDVSLPARLNLNVELRFRNSEDFKVNIGISQTGAP